MPEYVSWSECEKEREKLFVLAQELILSGNFKVKVVQNDKVVEEIVNQSLDFDLVILGFRVIRCSGPVRAIRRTPPAFFRPSDRWQ